MKTALKWLGVAAVAVVALVLAATAALAWLVDPEAYKPRIEALVKRETGRTLAIHGDLRLKFWPAPTVEVGHTVLHDLSMFGAGPFAELEALSLRLRPGALLRGSLAPGALAIEGLSLNLVRDESGRRNFDDLLAPRPGAGGPGPAAFAACGVTLTHASLRYEDRRRGVVRRLSDLELRAGTASDGGATPVSIRFRFADPATGASGSMRLESALEIDTAAEQIRAGDLSAAVELESAGGGFENGALTLTVPMVNIDLAAGSAALPRLTLAAFGVELSGELEATGLYEDPVVTAALRSAPLDPAALLARLGWRAETGGALPRQAQLDARLRADGGGVSVDPLVLVLDDHRVEGSVEAGFAPGLPITAALRAELPSVGPADPVRISLRADGRADGDASIYVIDPLEIEAGPARATAALEVAAGAGDGAVSGRLALAPFDLRTLLDGLGRPLPASRDPRALTRVGAEARLSAGDGRLSLDPLALTLDQSRIEGALAISNALTPDRALRFDLHAERLEIDGYLAPETESANAGPALPPLEVLRGLNAEGRLRVKALVVGEVVFKDVELVARGRQPVTAPAAGAAPPGERAAGTAPVPVSSP